MLGNTIRSYVYTNFQNSKQYADEMCIMRLTEVRKSLGTIHWYSHMCSWCQIRPWCIRIVHSYKAIKYITIFTVHCRSQCMCDDMHAPPTPLALSHFLVFVLWFYVCFFFIFVNRYSLRYGDFGVHNQHWILVVFTSSPAWVIGSLLHRLNKRGLFGQLVRLAIITIHSLIQIVFLHSNLCI